MKKNPWTSRHYQNDLVNIQLLKHCNLMANLQHKATAQVKNMSLGIVWNMENDAFNL